MSGDSPSGDVRQQAETWVARLKSRAIDTGDLRTFRAWLRIPEHRLVWAALAAGRKRRARYVVRPEAERFKVVDIWTGETAVIAMTPQARMSEQDAVHTARLLNRRAAGGDRSLLQ